MADEKPAQSRWVTGLLIVGGCVLVCVVLTLVYGNLAVAMQDTGTLMQIAGIGIVVVSVIGGIARSIWRGKRDEMPADKENEKDAGW